MFVTPFPVQLMTAAERAGFQAACQMIRQEGARMMRYAQHLSNADPADQTPAPVQMPRHDILRLCATSVALCVDQVEHQLPAPIRPALPN
ncbi:hypothetical protein PARHAE_01109 [Paracoccus haematequi]|uniref:Uncharacterized protein n=1 Tax=Paracoccus haematequi TaxID=2491866 RepID=A0A3S4GPR5_9RHOB|nr:hypothetical protein [Paracoccus haematequi]VDS07929.1 hypothetical protein PARHAE_01109 [Paracoccus haematequi]